MKRLLFVEQYGEMGGGQRILMSLLRAAVKTGHAITVLAPGAGTLEAAILEAFGERVTFIACEEPRLSHGRKGITDAFALLAYGWRFRRHMPLLSRQDVIYVNGIRHLPHLLLLTGGLKARVIYHVHIHHTRLERFLLQRAAGMRNTWALVVNSRYVRDRTGIVSSKLRLVENALDAAFTNQPFTNRFAGSTPWVAAVLGTIRPEKGQDVAIRALAGRTDIQLHIVGRDGEGAQDWIADLKRGAPAHIHFESPSADAIAAVARQGIQFNLVPSVWEEPFGLVAIEGMACSCLTIVSGRGGLAEIAARTGALVAPGEDDVREALQMLTLMPRENLAALARTQHDRTMAYYAPERFEAEIHALLTESASGHASGTSA